MKSFSARDAKQCFGKIISASKSAPVKITRYNKPVAIVMTPQEYRGLLAARDNAQLNAMTLIVDELASGNHRTYSRQLLGALRGAARL